MKKTIASLSLAALLLGTTAAFAGTTKPAPQPVPSTNAMAKKGKKKHHGKHHGKATTTVKTPGK